MIEFHCSKVDRNNRNTPILKDCEIEEMTQVLLMDYKPQLLSEPSMINYMHFLESYLGANVESHYIYNDNPGSPIYGMTAFNKQKIKVFERENSGISDRTISARTIILDSEMLEESCEGFSLFTGLHEGGHLWMHPEVYSYCEGQFTLFEELAFKQIVCCRKGVIEDFDIKQSRRTIRTADDWREHQADYFAASVAMPLKTFVPFVNEMLELQGINDGFVISDEDYQHHMLAENILPQAISEVYGVSKQAAIIRMKKSNLCITKEQYKNQTIKMII